MSANCAIVEDSKMIKAYGRVREDGRVVAEDEVVSDGGVERDGRIIGNSGLVWDDGVGRVSRMVGNDRVVENGDKRQWSSRRW